MPDRMLAAFVLLAIGGLLSLIFGWRVVVRGLQALGRLEIRLRWSRQANPIRDLLLGIRLRGSAAWDIVATAAGLSAMFAAAYFLHLAAMKGLPMTIGDSDVLLVIDVQNDFCPGGNLAVPEGDQVVPVINALARRFPHVVATQDWHPPGHRSFASSHPGRQPYETIEVDYGPQILWPDHCVQGTDGAEFRADLALPNLELVIRKGFRPHIDSYSALYENDHTTPTGLGGYLRERGLRRVFACGLAFDFCVRYSAEDARRQGFDVVVIEDACRGIDVAGSVAATRASFAALGIAMMPAGTVAGAAE